MRRFCIVLGCIAVFWVWFFYFNVSALTKEEYEQQYFALLSDYQHGYISYEQFQQYEDELTTRYLESNIDDSGVISSIAQNVSKTVKEVTVGIGNALSAVGESVKNVIDDVLNPYETTKSESTTDMKGYGAMVEYYSYQNEPSMVFKMYSDYGFYSVNANGSYWISSQMNDGSVGTREYWYNGNLNNSQTYTGYYNNTGWYPKFYGDWRDPNNTEEQLPTNDSYIDVSTYDFSNASDRELEELLNELNETLKRQNPDLSTMEGLLESIYYRLGALDSDNDNALLSDINKAIMTLMQTSSSENSELVSILLEIRDE